MAYFHCREGKKNKTMIKDKTFPGVHRIAELIFSFRANDCTMQNSCVSSPLASLIAVAQCPDLKKKSLS